MKVIRESGNFKLVDSDPQFNPELFFKGFRIGTTYMEDNECFLMPEGVYSLDLLERTSDFLKSVHYAQ